MRKIEKTKLYALAVSGGVDSMVLLDCFCELKKKDAIDFFVVTIDHGIRGESSKRDAAFVSAYCAERKIKCEAYEVDALSFKKERRLTVEQAARDLRYGIFDCILKEKRADYIVLAHQANDQAETVIMRVFRGTGISGLKGIADREGYLHPLLGASRAEIELTAQEKRIPFVTDETNNDEEYTRNFFRHTVFPIIKTRYPQAEKCVNRLAESAAEADELINGLYVAAETDGKRAYLPLSVFGMQRALVRASIMSAFKFFSISQNIEKRHIEALTELASSPNSTQIDMPYNIKACKDRGKIVFWEHSESAEYEEIFSPYKAYTYNNRTISFSAASEIAKGVFDPDKIPEGAVIRTRKNGDYFKRYMGKTKSLGDYFTDEGFPVYLRDETPVVAKDSEILLILGVEVSDKLKVDKDTKNIFKTVIRED